MIEINSQEVDNIVKQPAKTRYKYFLGKVSDFEECWGLYKDGWGLYKDGWALIKDDTGNIGFALWPAAIYAELCANGMWDGYKPKEISIYELINDLADTLSSDAMFFSIFMTPNQQGMMYEPGHLKRDIKMYCAESYGDDFNDI